MSVISKLETPKVCRRCKQHELVKNYKGNYEDTCIKELTLSKNYVTGKSEIIKVQCREERKSSGWRHNGDFPVPICGKLAINYYPKSWFERMFGFMKKL